VKSKLRFMLGRVRQTWRSWEQDYELRQRFPNAHIDSSVRVVSPARLRLGERVRLQQGVFLHCGGFAWSEGRGSITIGDDSILSPNCVLYGAGELTIGARLDCGPGVMIFSSRTAFEGADGSSSHVLQPVRIGNGVVIFAGCIIGPGVSIGDQAVIGAGSVVLNDVPARTLSAGVPAKVLREVTA